MLLNLRLFSFIYNFNKTLKNIPLLMKMHKFLVSMLAAFLILTNSFAGSIHGEKDPLEITYIKNKTQKADVIYQKQLRNSSSWRKYLHANKSWNVDFNEATQKPHIAYGKPIQVTGENPATAAMNFIETKLTDWNLPLQDLKFQTQNFSGKYYNVFYTQSYFGLEVINSKVFVKLTKDYKVIAWGTDVYSIDICTTPTLTENSAIEKAKAGIVDVITDVTTPVLKVLPVAEGRNVISHLVYEFVVSTMNEINIPSKYYTLVDANNGEILYRHNEVSFSKPLNSDVNVVANVFESNPYIPSVIKPLRNLKVVEGANTSYTDSLGNVSIIGTNPISATFSLEGLWCKTVTNQTLVSPANTYSLGMSGDTINFDSITTIRHTSGYYSVNNIHDFMKIYFPSFTGLDISFRTRIDVTGGSCNAFYSGNDINFYAAADGCLCWSQVADIVYHEYGHGINSKFYQANGRSFQNGAMNEGYADIWALSLTKSPVLGYGTSASNPNDYIRRYDVGRKVYPQNLIGQVHNDGEIIAGAWYDLALNLNSWPLMTDLFARTFFDLITGPNGNEGQIYSDILIAALMEDDDDADLSNGSPNDNAIIDAFALHGIHLLNNAQFSHTPLLSTTALTATTILASLTNSLPWFTPNIELHYRIANSGSYTTLPMLLVLGNIYAATIPPQPAGTIISYYVQYLDIGLRPLVTQPEKADSTVYNIPYFILVDCIRDKIEDFDQNQSPGWLEGIAGDNATGGKWIIAPPLVSVKNGDTCQTGFQFTLGGSKCAITGNAISPSSPNYSADVDGGKTTLQSPPIDISGSIEPVVSYWRWFTNDLGSAPQSEDFWQTYISGDGISFVLVEDIVVPDNSWRRFAFKVSDYLPLATSITLRFVADDSNVASVVECAVDDIEIYSKNLDNGIPTVVQGYDVSVFPNPAATTLTVGLNLLNPENISLDIVNNLGQIVLSSQLEMGAGKIMKKLDIQNLENGIYYLVVRGKENNSEKVFSVLR